MNRNPILPLCAIAAFLLPTLSYADEVFPVVHNESITVRVLSGKDGRPQARMHVVLLGGYDRRDLDRGQWRDEAISDSAGTVHLSNKLRNLPLLRVEVLKGRACAPAAATAGFSAEVIRRDGMTGANRCGSLTADSTPGVLNFYVKGKNPGIGADSEPAREGTLESAEKPLPELKTRPDPAARQKTTAAYAKTPAPIPELTDAEIDELMAEQP